MNFVIFKSEVRYVSAWDDMKLLIFLTFQILLFSSVRVRLCRRQALECSISSNLPLSSTLLAILSNFGVGFPRAREFYYAYVYAALCIVNRHSVSRNPSLSTQELGIEIKIHDCLSKYMA